MRQELAPDLTPAQLRFAEEHRATPGAHAAADGQHLFLYCESEHGAKRWLVDAEGSILADEWFRNRY